MKEKICVALDVDDLEAAKNLARRLSPWVGMFKIGSQLFTSEGPRVVEAILHAGGRVFLDLKYHDIPNTVLNATKAAARLGVAMLNVHASGGEKMMRMVVEGVHEEAVRAATGKPLLIAVTVLTSISEADLKRDLLIDVPLATLVMHFARRAQESGMDGIVCSPNEISMMRNSLGKDFKLVIPGIRPSWATKSDDQARVATPREAVQRGADLIIVGRPILHAPDPERAAQDLLMEIS